MNRIVLVVSDFGMTGMHPSHQIASGRRTNRGAGIKIGKPNSFSCHLVDIGRLGHGLAIAAQIAYAQVVGKNHDYVGLLRCEY
jgi:hypothetical protein